jgi:hypothetical protein
VNSTVQDLASAIVTGTVPNSVLSKLTDKILEDEKANVAAYKAVQKLKLLDASSQLIPPLEREQQTAWGQTNTAKFYALLIPEMQRRLGFTDGKPLVTPPDYKYIKNGDPGVFTRVADVLREQLVGDAAKRLISAGYMKESLNGLGLAPVAIGIGAAALVAAGITAYMLSQASNLAQTRAQSAIIGLCSTGKISQSACEAALRDNTPSSSSFENVIKYNAIGLGALVALQVVSSIRNAFPSR